MVTLEKIKKVNNIISTDYFPEGNSSDVGHIEYDIAEGKLLSIQHCDRDNKSNLQTYGKKAVMAIKKMVKANVFPETYKYMWY